MWQELVIVSLATPMVIIDGMVCHTYFGEFMKRQIFNYSNVRDDDILYYGFHRKGGRISIDTKRLKKVFDQNDYDISTFFPYAKLLETPRNIHYFIPKKKHRYDYTVNYLVDTLNTLLYDWENEYLPMIKTIKTPGQVEGETILREVAGTSSADDYEEIMEHAAINKAIRTNKYDELVKSIHVQYIQKISAEFLRMMFYVLDKNGCNYHEREDLGTFSDITRFVQKKFFDTYGKKNPIFTLKHHRYFLLVSILSNFTKHNSMKAYLDLYNNPFERNEEVKLFLKSFVYGDENHKFVNGSYAAAWVNIDSEKLVDIIHGLIEFSYEFCELVFNESPSDSKWNYDEYLLKYIHNYISETVTCWY